MIEESLKGIETSARVKNINIIYNHEDSELFTYGDKYRLN